MNVLVIPSWYPSGKDKLIGIYHKEYCEYLSKLEGISVNMLYVDRQPLKSPLKYLTMPKNEIIEEDGYKVYIKKIYDIQKISLKIEMNNYYKSLEKLYLTYLKNNPKPDVIHAHVTIPAGYAATRLGTKYNIPVVITEHSSYFDRFFQGKYKQFSEYIIKHAKFTAVSNYMAVSIKKYTKECTVLPNFVDLKLFKLSNNKVSGLRLIQTVGLRVGKHLDDTMEALKIIIEKYHIKDASLTIVGDGFLEDYYKEKCQSLNLEKNVTFLGRKTKEEIATILHEHNICVISSTKETFAIPGIEALASGLPVVSTKCGGPEEYIDDECGKLVSIGNPKEMASAIVEVYQNLSNYNPEYLRSVASKYSVQNITNKALKIYKDLIATKNL